MPHYQTHYYLRVICLLIVIGSIIVGSCFLYRSIRVVSALANEPPQTEVAPLDSIDVLIAERADTVFNSTIFGGLRFGDSKFAVEKALKNPRFINIQVPNGEKVGLVHVSDYDASYYNGRLASLTLYAEQDELKKATEVLFATKYGETKNGEWIYKNCEIAVRLGYRASYDPDHLAGYGSSGNHRMYYSGYRGFPNNGITKDGYFLKIVYSDNDLLNLIKQQRAQKDSLEKARIELENKIEREYARKLATQPATNI